MKLNSSSKVSVFLFVGIFLLMLICNSLTLLVADDFAYIGSYATGERIDNVLEIFPSMAAHAKSMNGRLVSHFFVQLFIMFPKWIFNIINALVFTLQIFLLYKLSKFGNKKRRCNNIIILAAVAAIWVYGPVFGQVNLWLAGSCNYLWAITFGLLFLVPYVKEFMDGTRMKKPVLRCLFVFFGLAVGAFSENGSAAFMFMAGLLLMLTVINKRRPPSVDSVLAIVFALFGYVSMVFAPATLKNKAAEMNFQTLRENFVGCVEVFKTFGILFMVFGVLLVLACLSKIEKKTIVLSIVLATGSFVANFMMVFASYYPERSSACSVVLIIGACLILMHSLTDSNYKVFVYSLVAVLLVVASYYLVIGVNDIYVNYCNMKNHVAVIEECKNQGVDNVQLRVFTVNTKYSANWKLKYLDMGTPYTWPNNYMASYYGVKTILGIW